jgi:predicted metal-dependent HD superfamily phosphohydrolase
MLASNEPWSISHELLQRLQAAYLVPPRAYHSWHHISEVLGWFDRVADAKLWHDPLPVFAAILFHDVIYEAGRSDNEAKSAQLARELLPTYDWPGTEKQLQQVADYIELTARHGKLLASQVGHDAGLFLDCDTAILAASPLDFDAYHSGIAEEYQHVPAALFQAGRIAFLKNLAAMPRIFLSDFFHENFDSAARANIHRVVGGYSTSH